MRALRPCKSNMHGVGDRAEKVLSKKSPYLDLYEAPDETPGCDRKRQTRSSFEKKSGSRIARAPGRARRARCSQKSFRGGARPALRAGASRAPPLQLFLRAPCDGRRARPKLVMLWMGAVLLPDMEARKSRSRPRIRICAQFAQENAILTGSARRICK